MSRPAWLDQGTTSRNIKHADLMVFFSCAEMFLLSALVTILVLPSLISGGQVPTVDGVLGGVSSAGAQNSSYKTLTKSGPGDPSACTPGKLRGIVENSCICGRSFCLIRILLYSQFWQRKKVFIRLPDMVT